MYVYATVHEAAKNDDISGVNACPEIGANVDGKEIQGRTPLHSATEFGHTDAAELLFAKGNWVGAMEGSDKNLFWIAL